MINPSTTPFPNKVGEVPAISFNLIGLYLVSSSDVPAFNRLRRFPDRAPGPVTVSAVKKSSASKRDEYVLLRMLPVDILVFVTLLV